MDRRIDSFAVTRTLMRSFIRWPVVRRICGVVLVGAAVLKLHELITVPYQGIRLNESTWFRLLVVEIECVWGLWLLVGNGMQRTKWFTLAMWIVFLGAIAVKIVSGDASCGCFGRLTVDLRITLGLDLLFITLILLSRVGEVATLSENLYRMLDYKSRYRGVAISFWGGTLPLIIGGNVTYFGHVKSTEGIHFVDETAVLKPLDWLDKRFPLTAFIDSTEQIESGTWIIVLYKNDCGHCNTALPKYKAMFSGKNTGAKGTKLLLVEMPPYVERANNAQADSSIIRRGQLKDSNKWFAVTPIAIKLVDGRVVLVAEGDNAVNPAAMF